MYVCVCHKITESELEAQVAQSQTPKEALKRLNVGQSCGTCLLYALEKAFSKTVAAKNLAVRENKPKIATSN